MTESSIIWEPTETGALEGFCGFRSLYNLYVETNGNWCVRYDGGCIGSGEMPDQDTGKKAAILIYETHQTLSQPL